MIPPITPREKVVEIIRDRIEADENAQCGGTLFDEGGRTKYVYVDIGEFDMGALASDILTALASGSGDHAELARLAEAAAPYWHAANLACGGNPIAVDLVAPFVGAMSPAVCSALIAENEALRTERVHLVEQKEGAEDALFSALTRATEAERKLAEAVSVLRDIAKGEAPPEQHGHYLAHRKAVDDARAFLNKEPA